MEQESGRKLNKMETYEDILTKRAEAMIHNEIIDQMDLCVFEINGKKYKMESYSLALNECKKYLREQDKIEKSDETFKQKCFKFLKQLFCIHKYVCDDVIVPPEYHGRITHYYLRCLRCGYKAIYEKID